MFEAIFVFIIALFATTLGRISGAGGAVMIKPILDATVPLSVSVVSFLSGCTVWAMTGVTLLGLRRNPVKIDWKRSGFLAVGACAGGVVGQKAFAYSKHFFGQEQSVGAVQNGLLMLIMVVVFLYVQNKEKIRSLNWEHILSCLLVGFILSFLAAFIGIGGGPLNVAVLSFFFGMETKTAALNSLFIIFCSQSLSISSAALTQSIPRFALPTLLLMAFGGIMGGLIGGKLTRRLSSQTIDKLFILIVSLVFLTSAWNLYRFLG